MQLQNGSFFQSFGKPIAVTSMLGFFARRSLSLLRNVLVGVIVSKKYAIIAKTTYIHCEREGQTVRLPTGFSEKTASEPQPEFAIEIKISPHISARRQWSQLAAVAVSGE